MISNIVASKFWCLIVVHNSQSSCISSVSWSLLYNSIQILNVDGLELSCYTKAFYDRLRSLRNLGCRYDAVCWKIQIIELRYSQCILYLFGYVCWDKNFWRECDQQVDVSLMSSKKESFKGRGEWASERAGFNCYSGGTNSVVEIGIIKKPGFKKPDTSTPKTSETRHQISKNLPKTWNLVYRFRAGITQVSPSFKLVSARYHQASYRFCVKPRKNLVRYR